MTAVSVAQACRVAELAFMGFLFFLLRNVVTAVSVAQACGVAELAFHDIQGRDRSDSESWAVLGAVRGRRGGAWRLFSRRGAGLGGCLTGGHEFSVGWLLRDGRSAGEFGRLPRVGRGCVSRAGLGSTGGGGRVVGLSSAPLATLGWPLAGGGLTCWNSGWHLGRVVLAGVLSGVGAADAERVGNFGRSVAASVRVAKPLRGGIAEEQWGTLKNPIQD